VPGPPARSREFPAGRFLILDAQLRVNALHYARAENRKGVEESY
jgi:hypothetical protein